LDFFATSKNNKMAQQPGQCAMVLVLPLVKKIQIKRFVWEKSKKNKMKYLVQNCQQNLTNLNSDVPPA